MKKRTIKIIAGTTAAALLTSTLAIDGFNGKVAPQTKAQTPTATTLTKGINIDAQETKIKEQLSKNTSSNADATKDETVYVTADANGKTKNIIVSDWLKNVDQADSIEDASDLSNIANVKGDQEYTEGSDSALTWKADGSDIYYQGTSTNQLPVDVKVTYYLDGKEIAPADLLGKSGKVKIHFEYTNNVKKTVTINGKSEQIYTPFTVISGLVLPTDTFSNIEIDNGKVISEGSNSIAVGYAFPGLSDSLDASDVDISIPDSVEITADCTDFELGMTMTACTSNILSDLDLDDVDTLDDLDEAINDLTDASKKLVDGSTELSDGANKLNDNTGTLIDGVSALNKGLGKAKSGADQLNSGAKKLSTGASTLDSNVTKLIKGVATLKSGCDKLIKEGFASNDGAVAGAKKLAAGMDQLTKGVKPLYDGIEQLNEGAKSLSAGFAQLKAGVETLIAGVETLQSSVGKNMTKIKTALAPYATLGVDPDAFAKMSDENYNAAIAQLNANPNLDAASKASLISALAQYRALYQIAGGMDTSKIPELKAGLNKLDVGINGDGTAKNPGLAPSIASMNDSIRDKDNGLYVSIKKLDKGANDLSTGIQTIYKNALLIQSGINSVYDNCKLLQTKGTQKLTSGAKELAKGTNDLSSGANELVAGGKKLSDGADKLTDGISQVADGAVTLNDGMIKFDKEGIQKLSDKYDDVSDFADRLQAIADAGNDYQTYTKLSKGQKGTVKFIIETEGITK